MAGAVTSILLISIIFVVQVSCGINDDISCANQVHRECKCDFDEVLNGNENLDKKWCSKLQACAECMALHRCANLKYIERLKKLLLTTIAVVTRTRVCPQIRQKKLVKGIKDSLSGMCSRVANGDVYDKCGMRCPCKNYRQDGPCARVRKEFTQMTFDERRRFVDVYYKASTDPEYKRDFVALVQKHSKIPSDFLHHTPNIFFPWHRWFILQLENFLRLIDCRVTAPYYQWTARVDDGTIWRTTDPRDVWNSGPQGIGGNGVPPSNCVQHGKFQESNWKSPVDGNCLSRKFDYSCLKKMYTQRQLDKLLKNASFTDFEFEVREKIHGLFHDCTGGNMLKNTKSAGAPEIILHHAFLDKIWDSYQNKGRENKFAYFLSRNSLMPLADLYPWQFLDNADLPGNVAVVYEEFQRKQELTSKDNGDEVEYTDVNEDYLD